MGVFTYGEVSTDDEDQEEFDDAHKSVIVLEVLLQLLDEGHEAPQTHES